MNNRSARIAQGTSHARTGVLFGLLALEVVACHRKQAGADGDGGGARSQAEPTAAGSASAAVNAVANLPMPGMVVSGAPANAAKLGATALYVSIYDHPSRTATRIGTLHLGAVVARDPTPAGTERCSAGWYRVYPEGYVCVGDNATLDLANPLLRAAALRPDLTRPLPYRYAFARAVAPLYLRIPNAHDEHRAEWHLTNHLAWYARHREQIDSVELGANDVPLDERGVARPTAAPPAEVVADAGAPFVPPPSVAPPVSAPPGPASVSPPSAAASAPTSASAAAPPTTSTDAGEPRVAKMGSIARLFGANGDDDPRPFWLTDTERTIPNVAAFRPPPKAVFGGRIYRHTGMAFIGAFKTGDESLGRTFAITTDLRLVPTDKMKPETASAFHGVELSADLPLPIAFVRAACKPDAPDCAHDYKMNDAGEAAQLLRTRAWRSVVRMTGKWRFSGPRRYYETVDGTWLKDLDVGMAMAPAAADMPPPAKRGKKWIDVSIDHETLVLWEGQAPVYATLVSAGQDGTGDPETTKSTVQGIFRVRSKHVTATMDSNERPTEGGASEGTARDDNGKDTDKDKDTDTKDDAPAPGSDGGHKWRPISVAPPRAEGAFELRDVPYVMYFEKGYALHAAYWHDVFGRARSHGCVNLSPIDAHRIFFWTDPPLPQGWHAVYATKPMGDGTVVVIHK